MIILALSVNDDGIYDTETYTVSCEEALFAGKVTAALKNNIVIGYDEGCSAHLSAIVSGILSAGKKIWDIGTCVQSQLRSAVRKTDADCGIFIENSCGNIKLIMYSPAGHPMTRNEELCLSDHLETFIPGHESCTGELIHSEALVQMYCSEMKRLFTFSGKPDIRINSSGRVIRKLAESMIDNPRTDNTGTVTFSISGSGLKASAYSLETGYVFWEKLVLICCINEFEKGNDIALPYGFPVIADRLAVIYNRNIYRYDPYSDNLGDISKKELSLEFMFLYDGLVLVNRITRIMQARCCSLASLLKDIPDFTTAVKYMYIQNDPEGTIHSIRENSDNDVCCKRDSGRIIAKKSRSGKSLILYAESYSSETADELCSSWIRELNL